MDITHLSVKKDKYQSEIVIYKTDDGQAKIDVFFEGETAWLNQKQIAQLFGVDVKTVNEHLQNIFKSGELKENSVVRKFRTTEFDGKVMCNFCTLLPIHWLEFTNNC